MHRKWLYTATMLAAGSMNGCAGGPSKEGPALGNPAGGQANKSWTSSLTNNPVTRGFQSATKKGIAAVTPQPKVVPAIDPIALDNNSRPPGPELYVSMGKIRERAGQNEEAIKHYEQALKAQPGHLDALMAMAHLHDSEGRLPQAERYYREAAQKHPKQSNVHNDLALCLARQGQLPAAAGALDRAITLQPKQTLYRNNIAKVLCELGRNDDALTHLRAVHGPAIAHYNLGYMLHEAGRNQQAAEQFTLALRVDPTLVPAQELLAQLDSRPTLVSNRPVTESNFVQTGLRTPVSERSQSAAPAYTPQNHPLRYPNSAYGNTSQSQVAPSPLPPVESRY